MIFTIQCDSPAFWQTYLPDPASITMEGILIFNKHLLVTLFLVLLVLFFLMGFILLSENSINPNMPPENELPEPGGANGAGRPPANNNPALVLIQLGFYARTSLSVRAYYSQTFGPRNGIDPISLNPSDAQHSNNLQTYLDIIHTETQNVGGDRALFQLIADISQLH